MTWLNPKSVAVKVMRPNDLVKKSVYFVIIDELLYFCSLVFAEVCNNTLHCRPPRAIREQRPATRIYHYHKSPDN
jgi:hypothetical protein